ncbi:MAG: GNAT family protein [Chthoniobacteraceae bacterium]
MNRLNLGTMLERSAQANLPAPLRGSHLLVSGSGVLPPAHVREPSGFIRGEVRSLNKRAPGFSTGPIRTPWEAVSSRILLRPPRPDDQTEFLAAVRRSRSLHHPWTSPPATPKQFSAYLDRLALPSNHGFLVRRRDTECMVGVINISNIVLGTFRSGYLGYSVFAGCERQGFMREGLQAVARHAFRNLKLHRLEANIQPGNAASIALVRSCGFQKEGFSPRYLKINGRWRDHEHWAILAA